MINGKDRRPERGGLVGGVQLALVGLEAAAAVRAVQFYRTNPRR